MGRAPIWGPANPAVGLGVSAGTRGGVGEGRPPFTLQIPHETLLAASPAPGQTAAKGSHPTQSAAAAARYLWPRWEQTAWPGPPRNQHWPLQLLPAPMRPPHPMLPAASAPSTRRQECPGSQHAPGGGRALVFTSRAPVHRGREVPGLGPSGGHSPRPSRDHPSFCSSSGVSSPGCLQARHR